MNKLKKLLAVLVCMAMTLTVVPGLTVSAEESDGTFSYHIVNDNQIEITGYTGDENEVIFPEEIDGLPVTSIGPNVFYNAKNVENVVIPGSVVLIRNNAFSQCNLLSEIVIPENVLSVGENAFSYSQNLVSVEFEGENVELGNHIFSECSSLTDVTLPTGLKTISSYAFAGCSSLTNIDVPSGVTSIENDAFSMCTSLTSITIPSSVTSIRGNSFYGCTDLTIYGLQNSYADIFASESGITFESTGIADIEYGYEYKFYDNHAELVKCSSKNTDIVIQDEVMGLPVTVIADKAFWSKRIDTLTMGKNVRKIGSDAFDAVNINIVDIDAWAQIDFETGIKKGTKILYNGSPVTEINISDGVTRIGDYAFYNFADLEKISIPSSVTSIGKSAFTNTKFYEDANNWEEFDGASPGKDLYLGDCLIERRTSSSFGEGLSNALHNDTKIIADYGCDDYFVIPANLVELGKGNGKYVSGVDNENENFIMETFGDQYGNKVLFNKGRTKLFGCRGTAETYTVPDGVEYIDNGAFSKSLIETVVLPKGIKTIGNEAFKYCKLTTINFPDTLTYIGDSAFDGCNLTGVIDIPPSVIYIGDQAFSNCEITKLHIPSTLSYLGKSAFSGNNLTGLTIDDGVTSLDNQEFSFDPDKENDDIVLPSCLTSLDNTYFMNFWGKITIPDGVENISYSALEPVTSPDNEEIIIGPTVVAPRASYAEEYAIKNGLPLEISGDAKKPWKIEYVKYDDCVKIYGYTGDLEEITLPDTIEGLPVVGIFNNNSSGFRKLRGLTLSKNISQIEKSAFSNCDELKYINMNEGLKSIGDNAFEGCTGLTSLKLPDSLETIGSDVFSTCRNIAGSLVMPKNIKEISRYAFAGLKITELTFQESDIDVALKEGAFADCTSLTKATITPNVTNIDPFAFIGCRNLTIYGYTSSAAEKYAKSQNIPFESIGVLENVGEYNGLSYKKDGDHIVILSYDGDERSCTVPDQIAGLPVTVIADNAFSDNEFSQNNKLVSITLPATLESIGENAFFSCQSIEEIFIPASVKSIGANAFTLCSSLCKFTVSPQNTAYTAVNGALYDIGMTEMLFYPYASANTSLTVPEGVKIIPSDIFYAENLVNLSLPATLTGFRYASVNYTYYTYGALESITVAEENEFFKSIDGVLFEMNGDEFMYLTIYPINKKSETYTVPDGVPGIGGNFCHNENLVNIILPESVGLIGCDTFEGCSKLRNITIYNPDADIEYNILGMGSYPQKSQITIYGYAGSTAEAYANSYNINFSYIGDDVKPEITDVKMKRNYKGDIVVSVDTNGILPTSKIMAISLNSEGNLLDIGMMEGGTITFDVWKNAGIKTVKVFCWESLNSMRPLCEAKEVAVTL